MSYEFRPDRFYRMPTHFGPALGPRQGPDGRRFANIETSKDLSVIATFAADAAQLEKMMPPGFSVREPCSITFMFGYVTECEWFAGRGYNLFGATVPVTFRGEDDIVNGDLQLVLWENKADPIITGREDLGVCKIYCELPEAQFIGDKIICHASWDGCEIAKLTLSNVKEIHLSELPQQPSSDGLLNYKYIPKTCTLGESDIAYAVLLPNEWPNVTLEDAKIASDAKIVFRHATWEELPTQVHIVNTFANLILGECTSAIVVRSHGGKDLSDHRRLR